MPVLTRLYGPQEFGAFAVFVGIVSVASAIACLGYDTAIAVSKDESDAATLFQVSALFALIAAGVSLICASIATDYLARFSVRPSSIAVGIGAAAALSTLLHWNIRSGAFGLVARARVAQSTATVVVQFMAAGLASGAAGLAYGYTAGLLAAIALYSASVLGPKPAWTGLLTVPRSLDVANKFRQFPLYFTWANLANNAALHVPVILISALHSSATAGALVLANYVVQVPILVIGSSVGQVYLGSAGDAHLEGKLGDLTRTTVTRLLKAGALIYIPIAVAAPLSFGAIFGANWTLAGVFVAWLALGAYLQFVVSPVSSCLLVTNGGATSLILQICGLLLRVMVVVVAFSLGVAAVVEVLAIVVALFYGVYLLVVLRAVRVARQHSVWTWSDSK